MMLWNRLLNYWFKEKGYKGEYLKLRVKEHNRNLIKAFCFFVFFIIGISAIMLTPYVEKVHIFASDTYFSSVSEIFERNDIVVSIAGVCSNLDEEESQIRCVNNFVKEFFYYDEHKGDKKVFRTPSEIINQGGCCRDYSVFYKSIFSVMGYQSKFVYEFTDETKHIYLKVIGEKNNYMLDQQLNVVKEKIK